MLNWLIIRSETGSKTVSETDVLGVIVRRSDGAFGAIKWDEDRMIRESAFGSMVEAEQWIRGDPDQSQVADRRKPYRAWINQPSTHQSHHKLHGERVIVIPSESRSETAVRVFFASSGDLISMEIEPHCLSEGWPNNL